MNNIKPTRYVCHGCRSRVIRRRAASSSAAPSTLDSGFARLRSRRLLSVYGQDAAHFLQGLTTQNIPTSGLLSPPTSPQVLYSAFMNAQGRLLHDVFIYPLHPQHALRRLIIASKEANSSPAFVIEVDAGQLKNLHSFLRKYKLRAKVTIRAIEEEEIGVYGTWTWEGADGFSTQSWRDSSSGSSLLAAPDPRIPAAWYRVLATDSDVKHISDGTTLAQADESVYKLQRYLNGIPEGQTELPREETLLHEANVDLMHGVDFRKGCYVGQELVIRTQHTGVIRKRVMPLQIWTVEPPNTFAAEQNEPRFNGTLETDMNDRPFLTADCPLTPLAGKNMKTKGVKRPEGRFLSGIGNIGLGLCRVERVIELEDGVAKGRTQIFQVDTEQTGQYMQRTWIRPFIPRWWSERGQIMEGGYESLKALAPGRRT